MAAVNGDLLCICGPSALALSTAFLLDSAELPYLKPEWRNVVRARFTRIPNSTDALAAKRANVAANYSLVGDVMPTIIIKLATVYMDDDEVIDLHLDRNLIPGTYTLTVASSVVSSDGFPLLTPHSYIFIVQDVPQDPISLGAVNSPTILNT